MQSTDKIADMATLPWWEKISAEELVALRRRLLRFLRQDFHDCEVSDLEDAVQAAFVGMFVRREQVSPDGDGLFRFLRTAARNSVFDRQRHAKVCERANRPRPGPDADRSPQDALVHAEKIERIRQYLRQLDDLSRFILRRHVVDGVSIRAIAQELNRDRRAVARMLQAAFVQVRRAVAHEE